jgi:hypothetical protein
MLKGNGAWTGVALFGVIVAVGIVASEWATATKLLSGGIRTVGRVGTYDPPPATKASPLDLACAIIVAAEPSAWRALRIQISFDLFEHFVELNMKVR